MCVCVCVFISLPPSPSLPLSLSLSLSLTGRKVDQFEGVFESIALSSFATSGSADDEDDVNALQHP